MQQLELDKFCGENTIVHYHERQENEIYYHVIGRADHNAQTQK